MNAKELLIVIDEIEKSFGNVKDLDSIREAAIRVGRFSEENIREAHRLALRMCKLIPFGLDESRGFREFEFVDTDWCLVCEEAKWEFYDPQMESYLTEDSDEYLITDLIEHLPTIVPVVIEAISEYLEKQRSNIAKASKQLDELEAQA